MAKAAIQKMKIYFACSVRGGRDDKEIYEQIVNYLRKTNDVMTEFNIDQDLTPFGTPGATQKTYKRDMAMLKESEVFIAEVTQPSLGVGYEIAKAEDLGLPILALYRPQTDRGLSAMVDGSPNVMVAKYRKIEGAERAINEFLKKIG
jgi:hypothetical protein